VSRARTAQEELDEAGSHEDDVARADVRPRCSQGSIEIARRDRVAAIQMRDAARARDVEQYPARRQRPDLVDATARSAALVDGALSEAVVDLPHVGNVRQRVPMRRSL